MENFTDIRIVGTDKEKTTRINQESELYDVYFRLSKTADLNWITFFSQSRSFPRHSMWREARASGNYIVVKCCLEEIPMHLKDLKEDVAKANEEYDKHLHKEIQTHQAKQIKDFAERKKIDQALDGLEF